MVMYEYFNTIVRGFLALGFSFMLINELEQTIWERAEPMLRNMGMSQLGAQIIDAQFYGVDAMLILGLIFIIMAVVVYVSQWS